MNKNGYILMAAIILLGFAGNVMAAPTGSGEETTWSGILPAELEQNIVDATKAFDKATDTKLFPQELNQAMDHHVGELRKAHERVLQEGSAKSQEELLLAIEGSLKDLEGRFKAVGVPAQELISNYQNCVRKIEGAKAIVHATLQRLTDAESAELANIGKMEAHAKQVVKAYVDSGRKDKAARLELVKIKIQQRLAPLSESARRKNREVLAQVAEQMDQLGRVTQGLQDRMEESQVIFTELSKIYGEQRTSIKLFREVIAAAGKLVDSNVMLDALAIVGALTKRQGSFFTMINELASAGTNLGPLTESVKAKQEAALGITKQFGIGVDDVEDLVKKYGETPATEQATAKAE